MKQQILTLISECHPKGHSRIIKKHPVLVDWLNTRYPNYSLAHQIKLLRLGFDSPPTCANCNGFLKNFEKQTCSTKCREELKVRTGAAEQIAIKRKQTNRARYGVDNPASNPQVQSKRIKSMIEKYGSAVSPKARKLASARSKNLIDAGRKTLREKYNVSNPGQLPDHYSKVVTTMMANHGVDHWSKISHHKEARAQRQIDSWVARTPDSILIHQIHDGQDGKPNKRIEYECIACGKTDTIPHETLKWRIAQTGTCCIACGNFNKGSVKEQQVADWISSQNIQVERHNTTILSGRELDIVIPSLNIAIEFCGLYWHNDLRKDPDYHRQKYIDAQNAGYHLITIFEDEWDHRQPQTIHRLKSMLGLMTDSIAARKTYVKKVSTSVAKDFINQYHIAGYARATHKFGLYDPNNELVAVMTFAKPSRAKGSKIDGDKSIWEISRFCTSKSVIGGLSKLVNHFIKSYDIEELFSYADLRWSQGNSYAQAGLIRQADTKINYWYISGDSRIHRFALRKQPHEALDIPEIQLRREQGYLRIWDCGHAKWTWSKKKGDS